MTRYRCINGPLAGTTINATPGEGGVLREIGADAYVDAYDVDQDGTPLAVFYFN